MSENNRDIWFKRKLYGWGWTPVTVKGWFVILAYFILLIGTINSHLLSEVSKIVIFTLLTLGLIFISYKKGETPRWQWGNREDKE